MPATDLPEVDVIVPLRNEAHRIPEFLEMLGSQTLRPRTVIVADGMSEDGSRELLGTLADTVPFRLVVVVNHQRIVPTALNTALALVETDLVARMDTHAAYAPTYLEAVVRALAERPQATGVGGAMATAGRGPWGRAIASTLSRSWGLGGARHRVGGAAGPIPHVFSGCYRTAALRAIGGWDERFRANEDFEADTRLREAGGELWLDPRATTTWFVRESPRRLAVQMYWYGYFKAATLRLHPDSLQPRQLAPPGLVLGLVGLLLARPRIGLGLLGSYAAASATLGSRAAGADGASRARGAAVPAIVHLSWGAGLLIGAAGELARPTVARHEEAGRGRES